MTGFSEQIKEITIQSDRPAREDFALSRAPIPPPAQPLTGQLSGRVIDAQGRRPLRGAFVSLQGVGTTRTDAEGGYEFTNIAPGRYRITITMHDFSTRLEDVTVRAERATREDFALNRKETPNPG